MEANRRSYKLEWCWFILVMVLILAIPRPAKSQTFDLWAEDPCGGGDGDCFFEFER